MTTAEMRTEIAKAIIIDTTINNKLSNTYFSVYWVEVKFPYCDWQVMYKVVPLNEKGEEMSQSFYFLTDNTAEEFMDNHRRFEDIGMWQVMCKTYHSRWSCLVNLYFKRHEEKGGVK